MKECRKILLGLRNTKISYDTVKFTMTKLWGEPMYVGIYPLING